MPRTQSNAIIVELAERLRERGSWCGETHLQKTSYFLKELMGIPLDYDFILYKHGPYSFDLTDEITALRADKIFRLQPRGSYGPSILGGDNLDWYKKKHADVMGAYTQELDFIAEMLGNKTVVELEQLGTALYVTREEAVEKDVEARARRLHELKPHVSLEDARIAVKCIDDYLLQVRTGPFQS